MKFLDILPTKLTSIACLWKYTPQESDKMGRYSFITIPGTYIYAWIIMLHDKWKYVNNSLATGMYLISIRRIRSKYMRRHPSARIQLITYLSHVFFLEIIHTVVVNTANTIWTRYISGSSASALQYICTPQMDVGDGCWSNVYTDRMSMFNVPWVTNSTLFWLSSDGIFHRNYLPMPLIVVWRGRN